MIKILTRDEKGEQECVTLDTEGRKDFKGERKVKCVKWCWDTRK